MGGVDKVKRQRDQGRLTVRERIDSLADKNSFHEVGAIAGIGEYDEQGELKQLTPANCVFGRAKVDGRTVVVVGDVGRERGHQGGDAEQDRDGDLEPVGAPGLAV